MLYVDERIQIAEDELTERFVRAPGPGGQNVNKVATAVQLCFDVARSPTLPEAVRRRLLRLAAGRINGDGVLRIQAHRHRTRERNRADARERLMALIREAAVRRKPRIPTRPSRAARERRLTTKHRQALKKRQRSRRPDDE